MSRRLLLGVLGVLFAGQASAFVMEAHDGGDGFDFYFTTDTATENPVIEAAPGSHLQIELINEGSLRHSLRLLGNQTPLLASGERATLHATAPLAPGDYVYDCTAHSNLGMKGILRVTTQSTSTTTDEKSSPWPAVPIVALALVLLTYQKRFGKDGPRRNR